MSGRKKYIIGGIVLVVVFLILNGMFRGGKGKAVSNAPEFAEIVRGDIEVPISATGTVKAASKPEIKCKASGTVKEVYFEPGIMVKKGDLLVELDPQDEEISYNTAKADVERAEANLTLSQTQYDQAKKDWPTRVKTALAELKAAEADLQRMVLDFKSQESMVGESDNVTLTIIDENKLKPVALEPKDDINVILAARELGIARLEAIEAERLIAKGREKISGGSVDWKATSSKEYQTTHTVLCQAQAKVLAAMAGLENAVNSHILIKQADVNIKLAQEALQVSKLGLQQAQRRLNDTKVYAPCDGMVQEVFVTKRQIISSGITTVTGGTRLMYLADVSKLYVVSDVDEADIGRVRELAPVERSSRLGNVTAEDRKLLTNANNVDITVDAFPEEKFTGRVERVDPNPQTANNIVTYSVHILLTSPNRKDLLLGLRANVKFTTQKLTGILKVTTEAIREQNDERGVYIEGPDKQPMFVPVKVGLNDGTEVQLKTNKLKAGQRVFIKLPKKTQEKEKNTDD